LCRSSASVMLLPDIKPKQTGEIEMTESAHWEEYRGSVVIPSQTEQRGLTVLLNIADNAVTVKFDEPVAGAAEWKGANVRIVERLKYHEIQFATTDLPVDTVELAWRMNAAKAEPSIAGVVVVRPNEIRISGEKGFILNRVEG